MYITDFHTHKSVKMSLWDVKLHRPLFEVQVRLIFCFLFSRWNAQGLENSGEWALCLVLASESRTRQRRFNWVAWRRMKGNRGRSHCGGGIGFVSWNKGGVEGWKIKYCDVAGNRAVGGGDGQICDRKAISLVAVEGICLCYFSLKV